MRLGALCGLLAAVIVGCAPTTGPLSPPFEVLVVLDRDARSLLLVPVDSTALAVTISLGVIAGEPTTLGVRGAVAAIGFDNTDAIVIVDLVQRIPLRTITINATPPIAALAFAPNGIGYAALPRPNRVTTFDPATGQVIPTIVTGGPQGFAFARGAVFVVLGNRQSCYPLPFPPNCPTTSSWLAPLEGVAPFDSIPLPGPGNASSAAVGTDGLLYVLSRGNGDVDGRLSVVDPVQRQEIASFSGLGVFPEYLASDGGDRMLIASRAEGLMVFDTRDRRVVRGAGAGVPLDAPRGVLADALGRIYVLEAGPCVGGAVGQVRVFGSDLVSRRAIATGSCPVAMALTEIPAELFGFKP